MSGIQRLSAGHAVLDVLIAAGADHAFCVPGESFSALLDAMHDRDDFRVIATRHEGAAALMAAAYGRLTGRPAVCMGTRMVGGGNLSIGVHTAYQDSAPMIVVVGQAPTDFRYREAFQEVDLTSVFAPIAKWVADVPSAARARELTERAVRVAMSGRPGPAVLVMREDVLAEPVDARPPARLHIPRPAPPAAAVDEALARSRSAERPIIVVGGGVSASAGARDALVELAHAEHIPVITAWRRPDAFPNDDPMYLGWAGLRPPNVAFDALRQADLVLAIGTRLGEMTTFRYELPSAGSAIIHVDVDPAMLGGTRWADQPVVADAGAFLTALLAAARAAPLDGTTATARRARSAAARRAWEASTHAVVVPGSGRGVDQMAVVAHLRAWMTPDTIVTCDAGNFTKWAARYLRWTKPGTFLAPTSGAMGYAIPAAIAAKLADPSRPVVALVGDGGMLMTGPELETAVRARTPFVSVVFDNEQYGTIRAHQERNHPGRNPATVLGPVDFAGLAESLGAVGLRVQHERDLPAALHEAGRSDRPAVVHVRIDPEQLGLEP